MKQTQPWHDTTLGAAACWLGSIQLAVPVLALVAGSLAWGTYLESTQDAQVARNVVYGSAWFMALMGLICVSLVFAVITRFPWKRRHVGFIIVHASLVTLIVGGFWSMFERVEGHLALEQGQTSGTLETGQQRLDLVEHDAGQFRTIGTIPAPTRPGRCVIGGFPIDVIEVWENASERFEVSDDGAEPYRAVQVQFGPMADSAVWIGDEDRGGPGIIGGLSVRVLAAGKDWQPPAAATPLPIGQAGYAFVVNGRTYPIRDAGDEAFPGWTIVSTKVFAHATVSGGEITEAGPENDNPALGVIIRDGKGTSERHAAFAKFADLVLAKTLEGQAKSGARLVGTGQQSGAAARETLVVYGDPPELKLAYTAPDGSLTLVQKPAESELPWTADCGRRTFLVLKHFTNARESSSFVKAPTETDNRPAMVISSGGSTQTLAWKGPAAVFDMAGRVMMLRFGPRLVSLPFSIQLAQFRKTDYPGTEMAMAYESDVVVNAVGVSDLRQTVSMNNPLVQSGWKVYQSGFQGNTVSIFSAMRDPGLPITYLGSAGLCIGIVITFYVRSLSWGHPHIPAPFAAASTKESSNVPANRQSVTVAGGDHAFFEALNVDGRRPVPTMDAATGGAADPGRRAGDAAGHVRS